MATFRKLPSGRVNCQIRRKGSKLVSRSFDTREQAEAWAVLQELPSSPPKRSDLEKLTFRELGHQYVVSTLRGRPAHYQTYRRVERLSERFKQPIASITKWDINDYKAVRLTEVGTSTCRDELLLIRRVFRWANKELLLDFESPCEGIVLPRPSKPRNKVVTPEEMKALLAKVSPGMRPVIELAYETAMRRSEILKLTPACLHLEERLVDVIDGKTGDRTVPLTRRAVELLAEAKFECTTAHTKLFPFAPYSVSQALRRAREALGFSDDIRFHQLRHTRISMVAKRGFNQAQIMMVSGHRDSRSVQRYTHLNVRDVIDLLE